LSGNCLHNWYIVVWVLKRLVGDRECLQDTGGGGSSWYSLQGAIGDCPKDKVCVWPSLVGYWLGSGSIGSASSIGLSGSSTGCSVSCSIEKYCWRWVLQGMGIGGWTGGRSKDG